MSRNNINNNLIIKEYIKKLPNQSGVYQMYSIQKKCLYVGKAKDLKKRVISYTNTKKLSNRIKHMIEETNDMSHIVTRSEEEALLLEADLIKSLKPKYNILLRDDKSFPYLGLSLKHPFPRLYKIKTKDISNQDLFGPFASSQNLEEIISVIQHTFKLRVCSDNTFHNRTRPCIYYQIKRCSAPCVNKITQLEYSNSVYQSIELLKGNAMELKKTIEEQMLVASNNNNFELAIIYRDRLRMLSKINLNYSVILPEAINLDYIYIIKQHNLACLQLIKFKNGRSIGVFHYFYKNIDDEDLRNTLSNFIIQYYKTREVPYKIICNILPKDRNIVIKALKLINNKQTNIHLPTKAYQEINNFAKTNTNIALEKELHKYNHWQNNVKSLEKLLNININRIEIFDNSHFKGDNMLGVMVVANNNSFSNKDYRIFKLKDTNINKQDDYGTLNEVLHRRLQKLTKPSKIDWPNLLIIDGGISHLKIALNILNQYQLSKYIRAISVAKSKSRTFGEEKIILDNLNILDLTNHDNVFKFILKLRDEAHRFAIQTQRKANLKNSTISFLDNIPGIGKAKKQALLLHFGSIAAIKESTAEHIHNTTKIGLKLAKKILEWLN